VQASRGEKRRGGEEGKDGLNPHWRESIGTETKLFIQKVILKGGEGGGGVISFHAISPKRCNGLYLGQGQDTLL